MRIVVPKAIGAALCCLLAVGLFGPPMAQAQQLAKRLILKDGSYQSVVKWQVRGDRVRYLSAERNEWEEVPNSLVDWPATEKYEKGRGSGTLPPEAKELDKEEQADRAAAEAAAPIIAPGLRLPFEGVFLLDSFQGQQQLVEVQQNGGELNRDTKGNILRSVINPIPINASKQTIELKGGHAPVQAHAVRPTIFVNTGEELPGTTGQTEPGQSPPARSSEGQSSKAKQKKADQPPSTPTQRFRLIQLESKKDKRVVGTLTVKIYGKVREKEKVVPANAEAMSSGWVKVTPAADLQPGEYALVEMLTDKDMNLYLWDFGVNPAAPANPSAWKPEAPANKPADKEPTLEPRKQ